MQRDLATYAINKPIAGAVEGVLSAYVEMCQLKKSGSHHYCVGPPSSVKRLGSVQNLCCFLRQQSLPNGIGAASFGVAAPPGLQYVTRTTPPLNVEHDAKIIRRPTMQLHGCQQPPPFDLKHRGHYVVGRVQLDKNSSCAQAALKEEKSSEA